MRASMLKLFFLFKLVFITYFSPNFNAYLRKSITNYESYNILKSKKIIKNT